MLAKVKLSSGRVYNADLSRGIEVGIPLDFLGPQPSAFGASRASAEPFTISGHVFDTQQGGSCNVSILTLNPHCNGTHTESIRHIADYGPAVTDAVPKGLVGATLVSVRPEIGQRTSDTYDPPKRDQDSVITRGCLESLASVHDNSFLEAVLIRTLPNERDKLSRDYANRPGPYLSVEAAEFVRDLGVSHLLVDMASVDRADDGGRMRVHHIWFGISDGSSPAPTGEGVGRTITELIHVENSVSDGAYLLQIQIAPFVSDASPSRPILYPLTSPA